MVLLDRETPGTSREIYSGQTRGFFAIPYILPNIKRSLPNIKRRTNTEHIFITKKRKKTLQEKLSKQQ